MLPGRAPDAVANAGPPPPANPMAPPSASIGNVPANIVPAAANNPPAISGVPLPLPGR